MIRRRHLIEIDRPMRWHGDPKEGEMDTKRRVAQELGYDEDGKSIQRKLHDIVRERQKARRDDKGR
jgi:hypothetical protein